MSLPRELVDPAKDAVRKGRAPNVSAYVAEALADKVLHDDLRALLDQMLAETGGSMTTSERRAADRILRGTRSKRR